MIHRFLLTALVVVTSARLVAAAPLFFVSPGPSPDNDLAWQAAVSGLYSEEDFESYPPGQPLTNFSVGGATVSTTLPDQPGVATDVYLGGFGIGGGTDGTVFGKALLNGRNAGIVVDNEIVFAFSTPVRGFGLWLFDDFGGGDTAFTLSVNGVESGALNFTSQGVEGFLGVVDDDGISSVTLRDTNSALFFEMDHVQVSPIPEPSSMVLMLLGVFTMRRRLWPSTPFDSGRPE